MAALGMETGSGDFEVIDLCFAGLPELATTAVDAASTHVNGWKVKGKAQSLMDIDGGIPAPQGPQADRAETKSHNNGSAKTKTWVALVSGLSVGSQEAPADLKAQLLVDWLVGENGVMQVSIVSESVFHPGPADRIGPVGRRSCCPIDTGRQLPRHACQRCR